MEENAEILDPASGSGTMLIESYNYIKKINDLYYLCKSKDNEKDQRNI